LTAARAWMVPDVGRNRHDLLSLWS
jgi:hypothetical protein